VLLLVRDEVGSNCFGDIRCDNGNAGLGALGCPEGTNKRGGAL